MEQGDESFPFATLTTYHPHCHYFDPAGAWPEEKKGHDTIEGDVVFGLPRCIFSVGDRHDFEGSAFSKCST
jgi:hypothetical protein